MSYLFLGSFFLLFLLILRYIIGSSLDSKFMVKGAFAYTFIGLPISVVFNSLGFPSPSTILLFVVFLIPVVEELARLFTVRTTQAFKARDVVSLGFGWGMIEGIVKVTDVERSSGFSEIFTINFWDITWIFAMSGVIFLHIICFLIIYRYIVAKNSIFLALLFSVIIHSLHNFTAQTYRSDIFLLLILFLLEFLAVIYMLRSSGFTREVAQNPHLSE